MRKYHITKCHRVTGLWVTVRWHHMTKSHGNHGKIVHRPCSSCIGSVGNLMRTPLSSSCQLRLGVVLRHLSLSSHKPHTTWGNIFYRNLRDNIKDLLVGIPCQKSNYKGLKWAALEVDEWWLFYGLENPTCPTQAHPMPSSITIIPTTHLNSTISTS